MNLCRGGMKMAQLYDVLVIGAGVVGCSAARELSKYQLKIAVAEKGPDVCMETSSRNSAVLHAGYTAGSLGAGQERPQRAR